MFGFKKKPKKREATSFDIVRLLSMFVFTSTGEKILAHEERDGSVTCVRWDQKEDVFYVDVYEKHDPILTTIDAMWV